MKVSYNLTATQKDKETAINTLRGIIKEVIPAELIINGESYLKCDPSPFYHKYNNEMREAVNNAFLTILDIMSKDLPSQTDEPLKTISLYYLDNRILLINNTEGEEYTLQNITYEF